MQGLKLRWRAVQVNRNTCAQWHSDQLGYALLLIVGDFDQGSFATESRGAMDAKDRASYFHTGEAHRSYPFGGERFSLLFYDVGSGVHIPAVAYPRLSRVKM